MGLQITKQKLYEEIVLTFMETESVKETAEKCNTYPIKVRRVLITEGLWESNTSRQIGELFLKGFSVSDIADQLFISEKNVQSYLPYTRGQYGGEERSSEAIRSLVYRFRNNHAKKSQVRNRISNQKNRSEWMEECEMKMMKMNVADERNNQLGGERPTPYAIKLHLELDMSERCCWEEEIRILKKYGKMKDAISREFIVPGDITLHALHYAINRAFGWQNSHLHHFQPYEEDYKLMIRDGLFTEWSRLAGAYFRFPTDDFEDIYWDDDYKPSISVKTWLRRKYTGPYYYAGTREYYYRCQEDVRSLLDWKPMLEVHKSFGEWYEEKEALEEKTGNKDAKPDRIKRIAPITEVTVRELQDTISFQGGFDEFIERIPLYDILLMPEVEQDFDAWHFRNRSIGGDEEPDAGEFVPVTTPILKELCYKYDYGDGWNVKITAAKMYETKEEYEKSGYPMEPLEAYRPTCVEADGLPVCDDVGGIGGYCNMLEALHGGDQEEKESYKVWARGMGWTGRNSKPENVL